MFDDDIEWSADGGGIRLTVRFGEVNNDISLSGLRQRESSLTLSTASERL